MSKLAEVEAAVPDLNRGEMERLEAKLPELRQQRDLAPQPAQTDLAQFAGSVRLPGDPLDWQRRVRGEWE